MVEQVESVTPQRRKQSAATRLLARIRPLARWAGVDRAVAYSIAGRGWSVVASPISLLLVGTRLSKEEQGFYYTFSSLLGLSVFFDLALGHTIGLFASHERAGLSWTKEGTLTGESRPLGRLASLMVAAARWYGVVALLVITVVVPVGLVFFGRQGAAAVQVQGWRLPWVWVGTVTAFMCFFTPTWAIHDGVGCVAQTAQVRLTQQVLGTLALWLALGSGWRLYATPLVSTVSVLYGAWWIVRRRLPLFKGLWRERRNTNAIAWWTEIWPLQWRVALSWFSAWWVFQMVAPVVLFRLQGSAQAGQMGMSLTISQALAPVGGAWISTKLPAMGTLVAQRDFRALDRLFFRALLQSTLLIGVGGISIFGAIWLLGAMHHPFADRIVPLQAMGCMIGAQIANHLSMAMSLYLRSHKREPLVGLNATVGATTAVAAVSLARYGTITQMALAYFAIAGAFNLAGTCRIFVRKRKEWHEQFAEPAC